MQVYHYEVTYRERSSAAALGSSSVRSLANLAGESCQTYVCKNIGSVRILRPNIVRVPGKMKVAVFALLFVFYYVECKKTYVPLDKNANVAFINMEGGGIKPAPRPAVPAAAVAPAPTPSPARPPSQPAPAPAPAVVTPSPARPAQPAATPAPAKPAQPTARPAPANQPTPTQIKPVPVNPAPVANTITTPGPGSVRDLVNFYNSQGQASPIRPYSYSQAVRQG